MNAYLVYLVGGGILYLIIGVFLAGVFEVLSLPVPSWLGEDSGGRLEDPNLAKAFGLSWPVTLLAFAIVLTIIWLIGLVVLVARWKPLQLLFRGLTGILGESLYAVRSLLMGDFPRKIGRGILWSLGKIFYPARFIYGQGKSLALRIN